MAAVPLYESPQLRKVTGETLRPGGFELTGRGVEICGLTQGSAVLDMGCGLGATVNRLEATHGLKAYGLDASSGLLQEGRSLYPSNSLIAGSGDRLPFREEAFDGIFCECVLSLLNRPERALAQLQKVLKPEGRLVITDLYARTAQGVATLDRPALHSCLTGVMSRQEILGLVWEAGFQPLLWEDHSGLLKQLAAKIVFEVGSMDAFWAQSAPGGDAPRLKCFLQETRPGYYLLVAKKREEGNG